MPVTFFWEMQNRMLQSISSLLDEDSTHYRLLASPASLNGRSKAGAATTGALVNRALLHSKARWQLSDQ